MRLPLTLLLLFLTTPAWATSPSIELRDPAIVSGPTFAPDSPLRCTKLTLDLNCTALPHTEACTYALVAVVENTSDAPVSEAARFTFRSSARGTGPHYTDIALGATEPFTGVELNVESGGQTHVRLHGTLDIIPIAWTPSGILFGGAEARHILTKADRNQNCFLSEDSKGLCYPIQVHVAGQSPPLPVDINIKLPPGWTARNGGNFTPLETHDPRPHTLALEHMVGPPGLALSIDITSGRKTTLHHGPVLTLGTTLNNGATPKLGLGYEVNSMPWLIHGAHLETNLDDSLTAILQVDASAFGFLFFPALSAGVGLMAQVTPDFEPGVRLALGAQWPIIGVGAALDVLPGTFGTDEPSAVGSLSLRLSL